MKVPSKPVKFFYKAMRLLLSDPLNERICLTIIGLVMCFCFVFSVIRSLI